MSSTIQFSPRSGHSFDAWEAERVELDFLLHRTPEANEPLRERLLSRSFELEQLIFNTHSLELPAIRAKARRLLWLMEMGRADGLTAMQHIGTYLELQA